MEASTTPGQDTLGVRDVSHNAICVNCPVAVVLLFENERAESVVAAAYFEDGPLELDLLERL